MHAVVGSGASWEDYRYATADMTQRRCLMAITLNHTIVPAHDKEAAAQFFAKIFGLRCAEPVGHFAPVRVNDTLTLYFDTRDWFESHHFAFHVSDAEFDAIFDRIKIADIS